jgi:hypothetical protein
LAPVGGVFGLNEELLCGLLDANLVHAIEFMPNITRQQDKNLSFISSPPLSEILSTFILRIEFIFSHSTSILWNFAHRYILWEIHRAG